MKVKILIFKNGFGWERESSLMGLLSDTVNILEFIVLVSIHGSGLERQGTLKFQKGDIRHQKYLAEEAECRNSLEKATGTIPAAMERNTF